MVNTVLGPRGRASGGMPGAGHAAWRAVVSEDRQPQITGEQGAAPRWWWQVAVQAGEFPGVAGAQGTVHAGQEGLLGQPPLGGPVTEHPDNFVAVLVGGAEHLRQRVRGHHDLTITRVPGTFHSPEPAGPYSTMSVRAGPKTTR